MSDLAEVSRWPSPGTSPRCYACRELFIDTSPQGSKVRHGHHIIPRAYGGSNGPVVDLCNEDHDLLHRLAEKVLAGKLTQAGVEALAQDATHRSTLVWLVGRVVSAARLVKYDPNKRGQISVVLTAEQSKKLDDLKKFFNRSSRTATLLHLIELTHKANFLFKDQTTGNKQ